MTLSEEEAIKIKEHLLKQLSNFPDDRRGQIEDQVNSMSLEEVEEFIKKNQLTHLGGQCIFCSIVTSKIPSVKIDEDSENFAILDINPLSKGHTLILPKEHTKILPSSSRNLAKRVENKLKNKLNPKGVRTNETEIMGHQVIEVIPIYGDETEKKSATLDELEKLRVEILKEDPKKEIVPDLPPKKEPLYRMPPRIP